MTKRKSIFICMALNTTLFVLPVQADTTIVLKDKVNGESSTFQVKGNYVRLSSSDEEGYTLYNKPRDTLIHVDDSKKIYAEIDLKTMQKQMLGMSQMRQQQEKMMQAQMASMPPEQRRMMEQQMPGMDGPSASFTQKAKGSRKVNGYKCKAYEFYQQERLVSEICLANASATGISKSDYSTLMSMMKFMKKMSKMTSDAMGDTSQHDAFMLSDLNGIPISMKDSDDGSVMTISSLSSSSVDRKLFTSYKRYTKQLGGMMAPVMPE